MVSFFDSILDAIAKCHGLTGPCGMVAPGKLRIILDLCVGLALGNFYLNIILSGLSFANYYIGICSFIFGV